MRYGCAINLLNHMAHDSNDARALRDAEDSKQNIIEYNKTKNNSRRFLRNDTELNQYSAP